MSQKKHKIYNSAASVLRLTFIIVILFAFTNIASPNQNTAEATHSSDCSDVFSPLSDFVVNGVDSNKSFYVQVMNETGVPWEMLAAIHYRETNFSHTNPSNGQGIFQFVNGDGGPYPPGPVSDAEFVRQLRFMASKIQTDYVSRGSVPRERRQLVANEQNIAIVKDTLFSYNGRASAYVDQAAHFAYDTTTQPYEGSPYVMNRFDCPRARMGIITRDYATGIDGIDTRYGAFTIFARLRGDSYRNSLLQAYSTQLQSSSVYLDAGRTQKFSNRTTVQPGNKAYVRIKLINTGYQTWNQGEVKLGTSRKRDSASKLYDSSWLATNRPATISESSVPPGGVATFDFAISNPSAGSYVGYFNVVAEGIQWLNDVGISYGINVVEPISAYKSDVVLTSGSQLTPGQFVDSPDRQSVLVFQRDGNVVLRTNFKVVWSSGTNINNPSRLIMQPDGNLVAYSIDNTPVWYSGTSASGTPRLSLQSDGNLVIYDSPSTPLWSTSTLHVPGLLNYVNQSLPTGVMYPGQSLSTANRNQRLVFQPDGNLVLYSLNTPAWSSKTYGKNPSYMVMQNDGNLVIYNAEKQPLWNTRTYGNNKAYLQIQPDGNLVIYNTLGTPAWSTGTIQ